RLGRRRRHGVLDRSRRADDRRVHDADHADGLARAVPAASRAANTHLFGGYRIVGAPAGIEGKPVSRRTRLLIGWVALGLLLVRCLPALRGDSTPSGEWPTYGNDAGGTRYSPLAQIDRANVGRLRVAWTYRTGETGGLTPWAFTAFEATPLMVDGTLFLSTPYNRVIALDPETGAERWRYDPGAGLTHRLALATSRGVSTWLDPAAPADGACRRPILVGTIHARLIALDAATGSLCADFGRSGQIDLSQGITVSDARCCYQVTSPPSIVSGLVVVGSSIGDNRAADLERGVVRAFDARSGALRWSWDPIPTRESDPARAT